MSKPFFIEVAYAMPKHQKIISLWVSDGTSLKEAIIQSGILEIFPEIDLAKQPIGVFGNQRHLNDLAKSNDRIEIYRPLVIDPKDLRRKKAKERKN